MLLVEKANVGFVFSFIRHVHRNDVCFTVLFHQSYPYFSFYSQGYKQPNKFIAAQGESCLVIASRKTLLCVLWSCDSNEL